MNIKKPTILIVDDEQFGRETLEDLLLSQPYHLAFAGNGAEALEKVTELKPSLILLDVMMPDMDGFEVCHRLKAEEQSRHIPIILVTALESKQDLAQGLEAGADDFLSKPVNGIELRARVRSMLRIKSQYDALTRQQQELEASLHLNKKFSQVFAQHLEALEVLHSTGIHMMSNLDTDSVLNLIAQTALDLIPEASGCVLHFLSGVEQQLLPVIFSSENNTKMVYPSLGIEEIIRQTIQSKQAGYVSDLSSAPHHLQPQLPDMRALLTTPMVDNQHPVGALSIYSSQVDVFKESHQYILSILANQAAVAIRKARFFKEREVAKEREKQAIRHMFQRYVNPAVVDRLVDGRENLALGGKRQAVSILFADIRGFTAYSEKLPPEHLVEVLNQYLALAVEAVLAQEGTLDKFMGDAVMAIFNAPLPQANHILRAIKAALSMQQAIATYNSGIAAMQRLSFGVGIHTGQAVVGNIGTTQQMNYTAIGDTVNLAKRLQENARGGEIILSHAAYQIVQKEVAVKTSRPLTVKGRAAAEYVYTLTGLAQATPRK